MPAGIPTDYTPELVEKAKDYVANYTSYGDEIPSISGLSIYLGKSRGCINRWGSEEGKEEFKDILEEILSKQENVLINKGLTGDFNSNITKLVLGKHGYSDKQDLNATGDVKVTIVSFSDSTK